jgi:hypothetical protein
MRLRLLAAVLAAAAVPAARGQGPADHPFRGAKVGDFATYALTMKVGTFETKGTVTNTVAARTDKTVTVEATARLNGAESPPKTQTIDLTKAFDPAAAGLAVNGARENTKVEKLAEGREKLTVGGKSYEANWTTLKVTVKTPAGETPVDMKVWVGRDVPFGLAKMEMSGTVAGMPMTVQLEQTDSGGKK